MQRTIHEAYAVYRRITYEYEDLDRIPEIFTDDVVSGHPLFGRIRGLEAKALMLSTAQQLGIPPEDHLWCMTDGNNLAFRARVWGRVRHQPPFVDALGHLIFDPSRAKFCFYWGFWDAQTMAGMLSSLGNGASDRAAEALAAVQDATRRFEARPDFDPHLPELLQVADAG